MEKFYSCEQVAERYGVKISTVWSWIREKKLRATKIGKLYRITSEQLEEFELNEGAASATNISEVETVDNGTS